jgi:peroxiredoxin
VAGESRRVTVLADTVEEVSALVGDGQVLVPLADVPRLTGWTLKDQGLCRDDACVPVGDRSGLVTEPSEAPGGPHVDLVRLTALLGQPTLVDDEQAVVAIGPRVSELSGLRAGDPAPAFALPGVDGQPVTLAESAGKKRLLLTWSSWCGCRHELPAWQAHYEELREHGFELISVAIDDDVEAARPFVDAAEAGFRTAVDPEHALVQAYGIVNVPSAVWIDEEDRIVRTPDLAYGDRTWIDFTGVEPEPHLDALRAWVKDGRVPEGDQVRTERRAPTTDELLAHLHYRVAAHLHRTGRDAAAERHFAIACELAPYDWTIRRGSLPLRGSDPFGADFFAFWEEWKDAGEPMYEGPPTG